MTELCCLVCGRPVDPVTVFYDIFQTCGSDPSSQLKMRLEGVLAVTFKENHPLFTKICEHCEVTLADIETRVNNFRNSFHKTRKRYEQQRRVLLIRLGYDLPDHLPRPARPTRERGSETRSETETETESHRLEVASPPVISSSHVLSHTGVKRGRETVGDTRQITSDHQIRYHETNTNGTTTFVKPRRIMNQGNKEKIQQTLNQHEALLLQNLNKRQIEQVSKRKEQVYHQRLSSEGDDGLSQKGAEFDYSITSQNGDLEGTAEPQKALDLSSIQQVDTETEKSGHGESALDLSRPPTNIPHEKPTSSVPYSLCASRQNVTQNERNLEMNSQPPPLIQVSDIKEEPIDCQCEPGKDPRQTVPPIVITPQEKEPPEILEPATKRKRYSDGTLRYPVINTEVSATVNVRDIDPLSSHGVLIKDNSTSEGTSSMETTTHIRGILRMPLVTKQSTVPTTISFDTEATVVSGGSTQERMLVRKQAKVPVNVKLTHNGVKMRRSSTEELMHGRGRVVGEGRVVEAGTKDLGLPNMVLKGLPNVVMDPKMVAKFLPNMDSKVVSKDLPNKFTKGLPNMVAPQPQDTTVQAFPVSVVTPGNGTLEKTTQWVTSRHMTPTRDTLSAVPRAPNAPNAPNSQHQALASQSAPVYYSHTAPGSVQTVSGLALTAPGSVPTAPVRHSQNAPAQLTGAAAQPPLTAPAGRALQTAPASELPLLVDRYNEEKSDNQSVDNNESDEEMEEEEMEEEEEEGMEEERDNSSPDTAFSKRQMPKQSGCGRRQLLRPWLEERLNRGTIPGFQWVDKENRLFKIPWKHRSKNDWTPESCTIFKDWAVHTGKFSAGIDKADYCKWKTRLRCAFNQAVDIRERKDLSKTKCAEPYKVYEFLVKEEARKVAALKAAVLQRRAAAAAAAAAINAPTHPPTPAHAPTLYPAHALAANQAGDKKQAVFYTILPRSQVSQNLNLREHLQAPVSIRLGSNQPPNTSSHSPPITSHTPPITSHTPPITSHTPPITPHTPPINSTTSHTSPTTTTTTTASSHNLITTILAENQPRPSQNTTPTGNDRVGLSTAGKSKVTTPPTTPTNTPPVTLIWKSENHSEKTSKGLSNSEAEKKLQSDLISARNNGERVFIIKVGPPGSTVAQKVVDSVNRGKLNTKGETNNNGKVDDMEIEPEDNLVIDLERNLESGGEERKGKEEVKTESPLEKQEGRE